MQVTKLTTKLDLPQLRWWDAAAETESHIVGTYRNRAGEFVASAPVTGNPAQNVTGGFVNKKPLIPSENSKHNIALAKLDFYKAFLNHIIKLLEL